MIYMISVIIICSIASPFLILGMASHIEEYNQLIEDRNFYKENLNQCIAIFNEAKVYIIP